MASSNAMSAPVQPGWYPDNTAPGQERWYDGRQWTPATRPLASAGYALPPAGPVKKRHLGLKIIGGVTAALVIFGIIGAAVGGGKKNLSAEPTLSATTTKTTATSSAPKITHATTTAPKPAPKTTSSISTGFGSKDASADVTVGKPTFDEVAVSAPVIVLNHSSKRSDYFIDVALETADGKTQLDTATVFAQNVDPGQKDVEQAEFFKESDLPAGAKVVIKSIQRTPSL